jgi:hypothetical protein
MSTIARVFEHPDGTIAIHYPDPHGRLKWEPEADWLARAFARHLEANPAYRGLPFADVDPSSLPADRTARGRWRLVGGQVVVGNDKAPV